VLDFLKHRLEAQAAMAMSQPRSTKEGDSKRKKSLFFVFFVLGRLHNLCLASFVRREEGLASLWKGVSPNIARNALINAAELASYDQVGSPLISKTQVATPLDHTIPSLMPQSWPATARCGH
jgi:hypothetical protein